MGYISGIKGRLKAMSERGKQYFDEKRLEADRAETVDLYARIGTFTPEISDAVVKLSARWHDEAEMCCDTHGEQAIAMGMDEQGRRCIYVPIHVDNMSALFDEIERVGGDYSNADVVVRDRSYRASCFTGRSDVMSQRDGTKKSLRKAYHHRMHRYDVVDVNSDFENDVSGQKSGAYLCYTDDGSVSLTTYRAERHGGGYGPDTWYDHTVHSATIPLRGKLLAKANGEIDPTRLVYDAIKGDDWHSRSVDSDWCFRNGSFDEVQSPSDVWFLADKLNAERIEACRQWHPEPGVIPRFITYVEPPDEFELSTRGHEFDDEFEDGHDDVSEAFDM